MSVLHEPLTGFESFPLDFLGSAKDWRGNVASANVQAVVTCESHVALAGRFHRALTPHEHARMSQLCENFTVGSVDDALLPLRAELANVKKTLTTRLFAGVLAAILGADLKQAVVLLDDIVTSILTDLASVPLTTAGLAVALEDLFSIILKRSRIDKALPIDHQSHDIYLEVGGVHVLGMLGMLPPRDDDGALLAAVRLFVKNVRARVDRLGDERQASQFRSLCCEALSLHLLWNGVMRGDHDLLIEAKHEAEDAHGIRGLAPYITEVVAYNGGRPLIRRIRRAFALVRRLAWISSSSGAHVLGRSDSPAKRAAVG